MSLFVRMALFVQIIVTNCMILGRLTQVASQAKIGLAFADAVTTSLGFSLALIAMGAMRETAALVLPLVAYPAGAFITFGLLLAVIQVLNNRARDSNKHHTTVSATA